MFKSQEKTIRPQESAVGWALIAGLGASLLVAAMYCSAGMVLMLAIGMMIAFAGWRMAEVRESRLVAVIAKNARLIRRVGIYGGALLALSTFSGGLRAEDLSSYRGLQFGMSPAAAIKQLKGSADAPTTVHTKPMLIQRVEWRPGSTPSSASSYAGSPAASRARVDVDPVKDGILNFVNGQLYQMIINYDRYRIEGMREDDLVDSISATYGHAARPGGEVAFHSIYGETAPLVAQWEDGEYSLALVHTTFESAYSLVLNSKRLNETAQAAIAVSLTTESAEAVRADQARRDKQEDEKREGLEKSRGENKKNFRP